MLRIIAVDWSGARAGAERKIWLAEAADGRLLRLESGRTREEVVAHLAAYGREAPVIAGLDFAFSLPAWWLAERRLVDAPTLWAWLAGGHAERLLTECAPPFWGRAGSRMPRDGRPLLRATDRACVGLFGSSPKSVFQIGGAGAVGAGSLRGMPLLLRLREAGYAIWPFDPPRLPLVVEIYPRAFTGPLVKTDRSARQERLREVAHRMPAGALEACAGSDDAFDAALSVLAMWDHRERLLALPDVGDETLRLEGAIWHPGWSAAPTPATAQA